MTAVQSKKRSPLIYSYARLRCRDTTLASRWLPPLNYRQREVLAEQQQDTKGDPLIMLHDVSQSISRCPRSSVLHKSDTILSPAILPGSFLWIAMPDPGSGEATQTHPNVTEERFLLADELLLLQGWPVGKSPVKLEKYSSNLKQSFAGNAFSGSVICSVFCALMSSIDWAAPGSQHVVDEEDAQDAIALLDLL